MTFYICFYGLFFSVVAVMGTVFGVLVKEPSLIRWYILISVVCFVVFTSISGLLILLGVE